MYEVCNFITMVSLAQKYILSEVLSIVKAPMCTWHDHSRTSNFSLHEFSRFLKYEHIMLIIINHTSICLIVFQAMTLTYIYPGMKINLTIESTATSIDGQANNLFEVAFTDF